METAFSKYLGRLLSHGYHGLYEIANDPFAIGVRKLKLQG